jgi:hypothetical protein
MEKPKRNDHHVLRISNMDQGAGLITLSTDRSTVTFSTPNHFVNRRCRVRMSDAVVSIQEDAAPTPVLPADTYECLLRHNLPTTGYDTASGGGPRILGSCTYSTTQFVDHMPPLDLGWTELPPSITIERLRYSQATGLLVPAAAAGDLLVPFSVTLEVEFDE